MLAVARHVRELAGTIVVIKREAAGADDEEVGFAIVIKISGDSPNRNAAEFRSQGA